MTIRPQDRKTIIIAGMFVVLLTSVVMISIFTLSREHGLFAKKIYLHTKVQNAQNLKEGAAVQLKGIKVGSVHKVEISDVNSIIITMAIIDKYQKWIKQDSYIAFKTQGVLGDKFLEILGGTADSTPLQDKQFISSQENSQIDKFINKSEDILAITGQVLQKFDALLGALGTHRLENIVTNIEKTTQNSSQLLDELNKMELDKLSKNLGRTTASLEAVTQQIEQGPGTLHALIYDRTVYDDLRELLGGAKRNKILRYFIRESIKNKDKEK